MSMNFHDLDMDDWLDVFNGTAFIKVVHLTDPGEIQYQPYCIPL